MESTTRQQALKTGATTYYTGRVCSNGHKAHRRTDNGTCLECAKDSRKRLERIRIVDGLARSNGAQLFTYKLHPDDHAAALAYCQMLDAARGRTPAATQALTAAPPITWRTAAEVAADNAARLNRLQPPAAPPHPFKP